MESKNYLVAGGTSGIGKEIVRQLLLSNHRVYVFSRNIPEPELQLEGALYFQVDCTDSKIVFPNITDALHGLVYCPGTINLKPFKSLKDDDFYMDWNVNFWGAVKMLRNYLPALQLSGNASVLFFSTVAVQTGMVFHSSIAAAKGAIEGFARAMAAELAPVVRVNVIAPSLTDTPLASRLINHETKLQSAKERHPLKRIGSASEVASLALLLLDERGSWITGQILKVDGGISAIK
ncbi:MAG: SDR family oxidoreductase [Bacteroidia bacterium]|nr:SDR family oxidoreductase [Bacteroidota bacterium]MBP9082473.1 SDR family oxidoreductase [Bacteroidia bacterium]MBK7388919.1 SDR family oxidoreductase [Bacteroidota bacterium]MBK7968271.1 SDR family oxidoreductase [Bacteroidota bacterium]MBK8414398.1 SDR family oxidoreductase [Bacteroidota bacterium]